MWRKGEGERKGGKEGVKRAEEREETEPRFLCILKKKHACCFLWQDGRDRQPHVDTEL